MAASNRSLYVHWPYCEVKCPYCDFNVHIAKGAVDEAAWVAAILADLDQQLEGVDLAPLETIYFGGGTPSLVSPSSLGNLIQGVEQCWAFADSFDISLEVHPTSTDAAKFADFAAAGITRASIGVQSFDDAHLTFLGRSHGAAEAVDAVTSARQHFAKLNLDLMTALPDQSLDHQRGQIARALDLGVDHLAAYQLNIKDGTAFGAAVKRGDFALKPDDEAADFFEDAAAQITASGLAHYEVSNFARPGFESRHSLLGWQGNGYVGIGAGAEGRVLKNGIWYHRRTRRSPKAYLETPLEVDEALPLEERLVEQLIFGLRLSAGLPEDAPAWSLTSDERIRALQDSGDLALTSGNLHATAQGRLRLDALTDYLVNYER